MSFDFCFGDDRVKRMCIFQRCVKTIFCRIHLVDRCLILFMAVLLLQSSYSLFIHGGAEGQVSDIDVIVRTSSASIFGYFLSANFIRHTGADQEAQNGEAASNRKAQTNLVETEEVSNKKEALPPEESAQTGLPSETSTASRLQIIAATGIGMFCLLTLLLLRNIAVWSTDLPSDPSIAATVTQFRDFVSGCVGFLIGCPTHRKQ